MPIGVSDTSAQAMFSKVIKAEGIGHATVKGIKEKIFLHQMCHPLGWLSHWMLKSDEYSVFLTGKRLWNVGYIADANAIEGVTPVDRSKLRPDQNHPSYDLFPLFDEESQTSVLKYLISKHALLNSTSIQGNEASISPIRGFYGLQGPLKSGEPLPLAKEDLVVAIELNRMICSFNNKRIYERTRTKARDRELNSLGI